MFQSFRCEQNKLVYFLHYLTHTQQIFFLTTEIQQNA